MNDVPDTVFVLWWVALVATIVVIVPVTLLLLHRGWNAARTIRRYTTDTRAAAEGIAANAAAIGALDEAVAAAEPMLQQAAALRDQIA